MQKVVILFVMKKAAKKYGGALINILFLRLYPKGMKEICLLGKIALYALAIVLFYGPIVYGSITFGTRSPEYIPYLCYIAVLHIISKFVLHNSKRIQQRFSTIKTRKFVTRTLMILEYIVLMWLVYLFYPLTCILFPSCMIFMIAENLLGFHFVFDLFTNNTEQFLLYGSLVSYVIFIFADGYRKLRNGFLPDYLGLYAILSAVSGFVLRAIEQIPVDTDEVSAILSQIMNLSNYALNIVSSIVMVVFAVYSLYTTCGTGAKPPDESATKSSEPEEPPKSGELTV